MIPSAAWDPNGLPTQHSFRWRTGRISLPPVKRIPLPPVKRIINGRIVYGREGLPVKPALPGMTHYLFALFDPDGNREDDQQAHIVQLDCRWPHYEFPFMASLFEQFQGKGFKWQVAACNGNRDEDCAWSEERMVQWDLPAPIIRYPAADVVITADTRVHVSPVYGAHNYLVCLTTRPSYCQPMQTSEPELWIDYSNDESFWLERVDLPSFRSNNTYILMVAACTDRPFPAGVICTWSAPQGINFSW